MLQMFVRITRCNICECTLFLAFYPEQKYCYIKSTKVCLFSHKSIVHLEIISSKALKMSRKKSILFFLKNQHSILVRHLLLLDFCLLLLIIKDIIICLHTITPSQ